MHDLKNQVAFITGGASGIGLGLAQAFGKAGAKVMIADIEQGALDSAVATLRVAGLAVEGAVTDVRDLASMERAAARTIEIFGAVHVVCNNAGVVHERGVDEWTDAGWNWVASVNLMGVVHGVQAFLPILRRQPERGYIINTSSLTGVLGRARIGQYSSTKFAVVGLSQCLKDELEPEGIGVSVLCPGRVDTNILAATRNAPPGVIAHLRRNTRADPGSPVTPQPSPALRDVTDAIEVGEMVIEAMQAREFYIFTDLTWAEAIEENAHLVRRAIDRLRRREAVRSLG